MGHTAAEAQVESDQLKAFFHLLEDTSAIHQEWEKLVTTYVVKGAKVHDARLVAAMLVHQLTHILTYNTTDFAQYSEITTIHPSKILRKTY